MGFSRFLLLVLITATVVGCKLRITVPEGGHVTSESGAFECAEGDVCTIDVVDVFFDEKFTAVPKSCYSFDSWVGQESGFSCWSGSSDSWSLNTRICGPFEALMSILESDQTFFLQPAIEVDSGCLESASNGTYEGQDSFREELRSGFNNCIVDGLFSNELTVYSDGETGRISIVYQSGGSVIFGDCNVSNLAASETMEFTIEQESGTFSAGFRTPSAVTSFTGQFRDGKVYLTYEVEFLAPNIIAPTVERQIVLSKVDSG